MQQHCRWNRLSNQISEAITETWIKSKNYTVELCWSLPALCGIGSKSNRLVQSERFGNCLPTVSPSWKRHKGRTPVTGNSRRTRCTTFHVCTRIFCLGLFKKIVHHFDFSISNESNGGEVIYHPICFKGDIIHQLPYEIIYAIWMDGVGGCTALES